MNKYLYKFTGYSLLGIIIFETIFFLYLDLTGSSDSSNIFGNLFLSLFYLIIVYFPAKYFIDISNNQSKHTKLANCSLICSMISLFIIILTIILVLFAAMTMFKDNPPASLILVGLLMYGLMISLFFILVSYIFMIIDRIRRK